jgi:ABC-type dipeptide/oligopeptide/nickel transport system permease subunit
VVLRQARFDGRGVETAIMRVMDGLLCIPPILLGIFVVTFLGPRSRTSSW